jgi:hypothetical protein
MFMYMKHGFIQSFEVFHAEAYRIDFGRVYYVASPTTPSLNAYVKQHAAAIEEQINQHGDNWLECRIVYLNTDNELFPVAEQAQLYSAMLPTINHPDGYPFFVATMVGCDEELIHEVFERYFRELQDLLDQVLDKGSCSCSRVVDLRPERSPIEFMIGPSGLDDIRFSIRGEDRPARTHLSRLEVTLYNAPLLLPDYDEELHLTAQVKALYVLFLLHPEGIRMKDIGDYKEEFKRLYFRFSNRSDVDKLRDSIERLFDLWTPNTMNVKKSQCSSALRMAIPEDDLRAHYEIQVNRGGPHTILLDRNLVTLPEGLL